MIWRPTTSSRSSASSEVLSMSFEYVTFGSGPIGSAADLARPTDRRGPVLQKTWKDARLDGSKPFGLRLCTGRSVYFPVPKGMSPKLGLNVTSNWETP